MKLMRFLCKHYWREMSRFSFLRRRRRYFQMLIFRLTPKAMLTSVGGWTDYQASRAIQLETLDKQVTQHKTQLRQAKQQRQADQERQTRKSQHAKKSRASANQSKSVLDFKAGRADSTQSRLNALHEKRVVNERAALTQAQSELENMSMLVMSPSEPKQVSSPVLHLADIVLPFGQTQPVSVTLHSGEKLAVVGDNGAGKSTLLRVIMGEVSEKSGICQMTDAVMLLDQHLTLLDFNASALDNFLRLSPSEHWREADYRTVLAHLRLRGDKALLPIMALSGGERLKVAIACVFLGETAPALLLLDEPDNHLDLASKALLASTLNHFNGCVLLISHDADFVHASGVKNSVRLGCS